MNARLRKVWASLGGAVLGLTMLTVIDVTPAEAKPPAHAPAHGYRRKHGTSYSRYSTARRPVYYRTSPSRYTVNRRFEPYRRDRRYSTYSRYGRYSRYNRTRPYRSNRYPRAKDIDRDGIRNDRDRDMDGDGRRNYWDRDVDGDGRRNRNDDHRRNPLRR